MTRFLFFLSFLFLPLLANAHEVLWSLDLTRPGEKVFTEEETQGQLTGQLPEKVGQNYFGWTQAKCKGEFLTESDGSFFRLTTLAAPGSGPQFSIGIPKLEEGKFYRLSGKIRNSTDGSLSLYLREGPAPYKNIGPAATGAPSGEWETISTIIQFWKPASDVYHIYFTLGAPGVCDFRELRLTEATAAEFNAQRMGLAQHKNIRRPDAKWQNFAPSSCFPFGVPAGWNCRRGIASVSKDCSGPSGQPALKLKRGFSERVGIQLYSAPFQVPDPAKTYVVSFSYRGGEIRCNGHAFEASETWKRASFEFQIPENQSGYVLDFTANETVWLDAVRVTEKGTDPAENSAYKLAGKCEIALGLPKSDASEGRIQFEDEPAVLVYRLLGDSEGVVLKGSVTNIWGETRELAETPVGKDAKKVRTLNYQIFPETPLGQFRVNLQAFRKTADGSGEEAVSPVAEFVVSRFHRPVYWGKDAPNSPFGSHEEPIGQLLTTLKAGGINWIRLHDGGTQTVAWPCVEAEKGVWTFHDDEINLYRSHKMKLYGQLVGAPIWASYYADTEFKPDGYWKNFAAPTDDHLKDFENYAYTMVKHYENEIQDWFVWNEPWGHFLHCGWDPAKKSYKTFENQGAAYAKMMKAGYTGAKRANPDVLVTGISGYANNDAFVRQIVEAGGYEFCDEIDYHEYSPRSYGWPNDGNEAVLVKMLSPITEKYGKIQKPIIMSEGSSLTSGSNPGNALVGIYSQILPWENEEPSARLADDVVRYTMSLLNIGVKRVFLYTAHGHQNLTKTSFQLLLSGDGYPHTSLAALSAFAYLAEDAKFVKYAELQPDVYAALYQRADGSAFAVICGKRQARAEITCTAPAAKAFDLYGNPLSFPVKYEGLLEYVTTEADVETLEKTLK